MSTATLSSPVALLDRTLWFGEIQLHDDGITISGWTWGGTFQKQIPLREITVFETWASEGTKNNYFRLRIDGEASVRGQIESDIGLWEVHMEADERVDLKRRYR
ncbi:MAG: hypothetical protein V5A20_12990 [Salinibacter sp.]